MFLQEEQILALLLPFCFCRESRACCPPLWSTVVRVSDWTNDDFSLAFLIGWLCISYEFYVFFMCKGVCSFRRIQKRIFDPRRDFAFFWANPNPNFWPTKSFAPKLWITIPLEIRESTNIDIVKRKLKTHIFNLAYYHLFFMSFFAQFSLPFLSIGSLLCKALQNIVYF